MRHVSLTCKNHLDLRWTCKEIAVREDPEPGQPACYNGMRHIRFLGRYLGQLHSDNSGPACQFDGPECPCPASDLIIAPEDSEIRR